MMVKIIGEFGYEQALYGLGLSYGLTSGISYEEFIKNNSLLNKLSMTAFTLYKKEAGHNKFLESIQIWLDVIAPRYWWSEADTYRIGETKQSESTMHTLLKKPFTQDMFEFPIPDDILSMLESYRNSRKFDLIKNILPEGFLQRRVWNLNYKVLRNIISQRRNHKLVQWKYFCDYLMNNLRYREYFVDLNY
jgi:hypothetical protein